MRVAKPWLRKSTGTWHVTLDGKQNYLGKDEAKAHAKFKQITQSGVVADCTVRQVIQAYWKWAKANLAESTCTHARQAWNRSARPLGRTSWPPIYGPTTFNGGLMPARGSRAQPQWATTSTLSRA
jgi:hypothetical protein